MRCTNTLADFIHQFIDAISSRRRASAGRTTLLDVAAIGLVAFVTGHRQVRPHDGARKNGQPRGAGGRVFEHRRKREADGPVKVRDG